ncbi:MAG TPA: NAD(P)-dependent oxidoreductase [Thermodesulfovibrionales bacterium]|nr:NAD(P)-dependent oxidoreductase [Thermodesulfovibrionales bacterium]
MKTGFIGLGHLGTAMARRLLSEGVDLLVWNRTGGKASALGIPLADSPARLISEVGVLFMNLFDSSAVDAVLNGEGGLLRGDCRGKIVIDTTTNHFDSVAGFHEVLKQQGASYLEAPVLGSVGPALQGALTILVSGERQTYEKALPLLEKIGKTIFFLGEPSFATKMKLINNLALGSFMATIAEALVLGEKAGIDKAMVIDILSAGAGNSTVLTAKKAGLLKEDFTTQFSSALIYKDLHYLQDLARSLRSPLFTGSIAKELFGMTFSGGLDQLDFSGIYRVLKGL